ncbi:MAG TPA: hypothetical protein VKU19_03835 [Bryobacteraceae bacterium]|nr:hypothetical protein [Bryobacteraceae bacterium]
MREPRLGDDIDDFCIRCKRITNHAIVSVVNGEPAKVRCRTCHSDHDYRHEQAPPPKVDLRKQALYNEVLKKVNPDGAGKPELVEVPDLGDLDESPEETDSETTDVEAADTVESADSMDDAPPPPPAKKGKVTKVTKVKAKK